MTIVDNGIGLSPQEAIDNRGAIARSGTRDFMARLLGHQKNDAQLMGQFGVGFYSGFIVAHNITVESRHAGRPRFAHDDVLNPGAIEPAVPTGRLRLCQ